MYIFPIETLLETFELVVTEKYEFEDRGKPKMLALFGISVYQNFEPRNEMIGFLMD